MTLALITIVIAMIGPTAEAGITTKTIAYEDQGQSLQGYLAYDDAVKGRRPAILVVHEWWGLNDYVRKRVDQLAGLGYVAFAPDMYGKGRVTEHPKEAGEWATQVSKNSEFWRRRALAGLAVLKNQPQSDPIRIAAIGYCSEAARSSSWHTAGPIFAVSSVFTAPSRCPHRTPPP